VEVSVAVPDPVESVHVVPGKSFSTYPLMVSNSCA